MLRIALNVETLSVEFSPHILPPDSTCMAVAPNMRQVAKRCFFSETQFDEAPSDELVSRQ